MAVFMYGLSAFFFLCAAFVLFSLYMEREELSGRQNTMAWRTGLGLGFLSISVFLSTMFGQWMGS